MADSVWLQQHADESHWVAYLERVMRFIVSDEFQGKLCWDSVAVFGSSRAAVTLRSLKSHLIRIRESRLQAFALRIIIVAGDYYLRRCVQSCR